VYWGWWGARACMRDTKILCPARATPQKFCIHPHGTWIHAINARKSLALHHPHTLTHSLFHFILFFPFFLCFLPDSSYSFIFFLIRFLLFHSYFIPSSSFLALRTVIERVRDWRKEREIGWGRVIEILREGSEMKSKRSRGRDSLEKRDAEAEWSLDP